MDKTDTIVATTFSSDFLEAVSGRGVNAIARLAPGFVSSDGSLTNQGTINIRGGTGKSTKTLLNGSTITEAYGGYMYGSYVLEDLLESTSLIQSPINSRYGNTDGGIIAMVTSKGSNTFTGTLRVNISRSYWSIHDAGYRQRDGVMGVSNISTTDNLNRDYEVSIQGPIWKDRITFAYGAKLQPVTYSSQWAANLGDRQNMWWGYNTRTPNPLDMVGTYYRNPDNGDVVRRAELFAYNTFDYAVNRDNTSKYNQFTFFFQITPQHQLEYNHSQSDSITNGYSGSDYVIATDPEDAWWNQYRQGQRQWSLVYKGIIGSHGVLDVSYGKYENYWKYGSTDRANPFPIRVWSMASYVPINASLPESDPNKYHVNGFLWATAHQNNITIGPATNANAIGFRNRLHNGVNVDNRDSGLTETRTLNYQHILNTTKGTHMFDVGMNFNGLTWTKKAPGAMQMFDVPGMINKSLTLDDIYNPDPSKRADPTEYAGQYIVFNMRTARLSDIDPTGFARFGYVDRQLSDVLPNNANNVFPAYWTLGASGSTLAVTNALNNAFLPKVIYRYGDASGNFKTNMTSYYLNDLWTINDFHSLQGGLRVDKFDVLEEQVDGPDKKVFSYTQPTFRFEYKWDIYGNQSRLVNLSWAQFHSMQPVGLFRPLMISNGSNYVYKYWDKGPSHPYLVSKEELLNLDNYGLEGLRFEAADTYRISLDWKAPISTEIQLGFRRNLSLGGFWKATFVYRTWINDFDYYYSGDFTVTPSNQLAMVRELRNSEGYERKYTGVELEWDYPIFKRTTFGGSYTYNRLMSNVPDRTDVSGGNDVTDTPGINQDAYWDAMTGGRDVWRPSRLINPEHYFKWYVLFDLSSGKIKSSLAFNGMYTSATVYQNGFNYQYGFPYGFYEGFDRLISGTQGNTAPSYVQDEKTITPAGTAQMSQTVFVPTNTSTNGDSWDMNVRYMLTVPMSGKISWLLTVNISSPFNHRGRTYNFSTGSTPDLTIIPENLTTNNPNGSVTINTYNRDPYEGVWRSGGGPWRDLYTNRQGGRSFSVTTGLRF